MLNSLINFNPNDFVIRISPDVDDNGDWTGDLDSRYANDR
jgi:hypothetical protein